MPRKIKTNPTEIPGKRKHFPEYGLDPQQADPHVAANELRGLWPHSSRWSLGRGSLGRRSLRRVLACGEHVLSVGIIAVVTIAAWKLASWTLVS